MNKPIFYNISVMIISLFFYSCIENNIINEEIEFDRSARFLHFLEGQGDFINTTSRPGNESVISEMPSVIDAQDVYNNLDSYLIIDLRDKKDFNKGHIKNAINLSNAELYNYISDKSNQYDKIILVSYTGQAACYYLTLFRYLNINNVYSLKFGMCSWNNSLAGYWQKAVTKYSLKPIIKSHITKEEYFNLPELNLSDENDYRQRIIGLINDEFIDTLNRNYESEKNDYGNSVSLDFNHADTSDNVICFTWRAAYEHKGHIFIPGTVLCDIFERELRSDKHLQTIPNNRRILVSSLNGFEGACATAYLRILGFDAKCILYGLSNIMIVNDMSYTENKFFYRGEINNFELVQ